MAFTFKLSPVKHDIILPGFITKPCLHSKSHSSRPLFFNLVSPIDSKKVRATITNVSTDLIYNDVNPKFGEEKLKLPAGLVEELMPKHIAFIMDGNRRWAQEKGWSPMTGHRAMRKTLQSLLLKCNELKIKTVSIFAFSTENWTRPTEQVDFLMEMYEDLLRTDAEVLLSLGCQVSVMGRKSDLPESFQKLCVEIDKKSRLNSGTHVNYAINYGGRYDIIQACRSIATKVKDGVLIPNQIDEKCFKQELCTKTIDFPYPDLVIRTSGEIRLSNFMLWQMAYSELYFVKKYFPDFGENDLIEALLAFQEMRK